ncbi:hypothetical protein GLOIN_2v1774909 [Rhizophagus irregularis DAOM 181602=DAOM 197198]|nr:hypothetical protein GLOIN_2v1774909 [Rhizophagus irregularis DAOM 181602=DAOM 197198]
MEILCVRKIAQQVCLCPKRTNELGISSGQWISMTRLLMASKNTYWLEIFTSERSRPLQNAPIKQQLLLIETPSKPFNEWTFPKVCELYGLSDDPNPSTDVFPLFSCGSANLSSDKSKAVVKHLIAELKLRQDVTPLDRAYEATKTIYSYCYLASAVSFYKDNFKLIPEKPVEGRNGQGNLDYAVECRSTGGILADEINNGQDVDRVFGIVTDASEWYFMECLLDHEGKPTFKLSEQVTVVYKDENLQDKVEKVLGHIVWLLEEAQKPMESGEGLEK